MRVPFRRSLSHYNFMSLPCLLAALSFAALTGQAQTKQLPENLPMPEYATKEKKPAVLPENLANGKDLYCTGYITDHQLSTNWKIIGGEEENRLAHFGQSDVVYISVKDAHVDEIYAIARPMGEIKNQHTPQKKTERLGQYIRELGVLRVIAVQGDIATARIIFSCSDIQMGDLLVPFETRTSPKTDMQRPLPRYQTTSGQKPGRIIYQREQKEMLAPRDVVYIDLGADAGVKSGDKFTIFRPNPTNLDLVKFRDDDVVIRQSGGYQSDHYKGGILSNDHPLENRQRVKDTRPAIPQKILGELVIIAVQGKTASAVITRVVQEVHTGDYIEALQ